MTAVPQGHSISFEAENKKFYIGRSKNYPNALGVVPENATIDPPTFAFKQDSGEDKCQILFEGQSVCEKDGKLCLEQPDGDDCDKWRFVPVRDGYVIIGGVEDKRCWKLGSSGPSDSSNESETTYTCANCDSECKCQLSNVNGKCHVCAQGPGECVRAHGANSNLVPTADTLVVLTDCSGCPSRCLAFSITPPPPLPL